MGVLAMGVLSTAWRVAVWSITGVVVFECSWWMTGGGYRCAVPIFLALFCYCYGGKSMLTPSTLAGNIRANAALMMKEDKKSALLMSSYFAIKFGFTFCYPEGEKSNGSPWSLIAFTVLFILIYLVPGLLSVFAALLKECFQCETTRRRGSTCLLRSEAGIFRFLLQSTVQVEAKHLAVWTSSLGVVLLRWPHYCNTAFFLERALHVGRCFLQRAIKQSTFL